MKLSTILACIFFMGFAAFSVKIKRDIARKEAMESFQGPLSYGSTPPGFELSSAGGASFRLEEAVKGKKVVVINFWATWCPPCRLEMPQLETLYGRYRDSGLEIVAINVGEDEETVRSYLAAKPVTYPVLLDREKLVSMRYRIEALPTTVILDAEGKVVHVNEGLDPYLDYWVESELDPEAEQEP